MACSHPPIPEKPGNRDNWIERQGGMPEPIECLARALYHGSGRASGNRSKAYEMALGIARDWAAGRRGVSKQKQAKYAAAIAKWDAMRARERNN